VIVSGSPTGAYVGAKYIADMINGEQIKIEEKIKKDGTGLIDSDKKKSGQDKPSDIKKIDDKSTQESVKTRKAAEKSIRQKNDTIENKKHKSELESDPLSEVPTL
jgi:hypothetical protein